MSHISGVMGGFKVRELKKAVLNGDVDTVKHLVLDGHLDLAHYYHDEPTQSTALILATRRNHVDVVRILVAGQDTERHIDLKDIKWGKTALMFACEYGHTKVVKVLLEKGVKVKYPKQKTGCTALILAAKYGNVDIVQLLIHKSDINAINRCGYTALMATILEGKSRAASVVQALLDANADMNLQDNEGWTAVMHAVRQSRTEIITLLVKHGADLDIENNKAQTAWTIANQHMNTHLYELLETSQREHTERVRRDSIHIEQEMKNQVLQQGHDLIAQRISDALSMEQLIVDIPIEYIMHCTDNFSLSNRLGEGRFGQVFKAQDGDQVFVVKLLNDDGMSSFRTEKEVLQRIHHKSIVRLFGTSIYGRQEILILEYLSEGALSGHLSDDDKRKRLYPSVRIKIMYKIALALHCLRNEGQKYHLCHGDVKSANICLDGNYSPKLIDWGLSKIKVVEGRDQFLSIAPTFLNNHNDGAGTFGYMCPKYKQGLIDEYEGACDVYSFGVVMFELITGRLVAEGDLVQMYKTAEKLSENADPIFAGAWSGALFDLCQLALSCVEYELTDRSSLEDIILKLSCIRIKFKESRREKLKSIIQRVIQKAGNGETDVDTHEPQDDLPNSTETTSTCHQCTSLVPINEESSNRSVDLEMIDEMTAIKQRLALLEGSARDAEIQKLTEKLENLEKEADEAREFRRTVWKILTVVVTENHPCPRFVVVKPLSVDSSNWSFQRLLNNEAIVYFICERSYESVEAFKVKITHEWVKKAAPVLQITWEILKKGSAFMIPMGDILGGVADALVTMTTSLLQGGCPTFDPSFLIELATGTSHTGSVAGPSARHDMYEVTKGYYSTFAEMALQPENDAWRSKMCAVPSSEGGHKWVKAEYSQIIS